MSDQTADIQRTPLTKAQALVLCALLCSIAAAFGWVSARLYFASLPPLVEQARIGSLIGRSIHTIDCWERHPDAVPAAAGWQYTFSTRDSFGDATIVAVNTDAKGRIVDCRIFVNDTASTQSCFRWYPHGHILN